MHEANHVGTLKVSLEKCQADKQCSQQEFVMQWLDIQIHYYMNHTSNQLSYHDINVNRMSDVSHPCMDTRT
jgi:hypothetical protein